MCSISYLIQPVHQRILHDGGLELAQWGDLHLFYHVVCQPWHCCLKGCGRLRLELCLHAYIDATSTLCCAQEPLVPYKLVAGVLEWLIGGRKRIPTSMPDVLAWFWKSWAVYRLVSPTSFAICV